MFTLADISLIKDILNVCQVLVLNKNAENIILSIINKSVTANATFFDVTIYYNHLQVVLT